MVSKHQNCCVYLANTRFFLYKNVYYSQLPASSLKLVYESRVNMKIQLLRRGATWHKDFIDPKGKKQA